MRPKSVLSPSASLRLAPAGVGKVRAIFGHRHFILILALLAVVTVAAFTAAGPLAWIAGFLYIGYDTWLLFFVAAKTSDCWMPPPPLPPSQGPPPTMTAVIAARNERLVLGQCLDSLRRQAPPLEEIFIVDDGSTDGSSAWLEESYQLAFTGPVGTSTLDPRLKVLRKTHTGKADSLNRVWPIVRSEIVVTIDADTLLEPEALGAMRAAFAAEPELAAACGVLIPQCRPTLIGLLFETFQSFEYIRTFLARQAWMRQESLLLVSGAFAAYRLDVLKRLGGYDPKSLVEDYDLIHRLHRYSAEHGCGMRVRLIAGARAGADAPATPRAFLKQRLRWFGGFLQTQFKNRDMVGNPDYGAVGTLMLPVKAIDTLQPIYGLLAFITLVSLVLTGEGVHGLILWVIGGKLALDLAFHFWFVLLYHRWQGLAFTKSSFLKATFVTLAEPVSFQLLRHTGALLGWLGFLSGAGDWTPQRDAQMSQAHLREEHETRT
jgi:cellulose synthase/poly-beta-1,6-N-acetylglucosamine synthase-like glycosyltransferase